MLLVYAVGGDGDSAELGAFQGVKASNKGVTVLKGKSNVCFFYFCRFKGLCSVS